MTKEDLLNILTEKLDEHEQIFGCKKFHGNKSLQIKTADGTYFNLILHELVDTKYNLVDGRSYTQDMLEWCERMREQECKTKN